MKTKATADIYVDEKLVVEAGESCTVSWVDDYKGRVFLQNSNSEELSVTIEVFNSFFK